MLAELVGRTFTFTASEPIGPTAGRLYALALGEFTREEDPLPPTLIFDTFQIYRGPLKESGHFSVGPPLPVELPLRAGNAYEFGRPATPNDVLTANWKVTGTREVHGGSGRLVFLDVEIVYTNQHGDWLGTNRETLFWRPENSDSFGNDQG
jgi:N-terminal half of MaoC dehydratase